MSAVETPNLSPEQTLRDITVVTLDTQDGKDRAIHTLITDKLIVADFGSTFGVVFLPQDRKLIAARRQEDLQTALARASLFTTVEMVKKMWPISLDPLLFNDAVERMKDVGFVRFPFDRNALAFIHADPEYMRALEEYCLNDSGGIQVFPLSHHPLIAEWVTHNPTMPALGVRSANITGKQEQAVLDGAEKLAQDMGSDALFILSQARFKQAQRDQAILFKNGLTKDTDGYAAGAYSIHPEMMQKRWGSVPIISLNENGVDYYLDRVGNTESETLAHLLTAEAGGRSVAVREGTQRDYRTQFAAESYGSWQENHAELVTAAQVLLGLTAQEEVMPARSWQSRRQA